MADIFNGGTVKLFYNLDTANQNVISSGNIEIENVATFPTFSISDSANKIETYDSEYTRTVVGDKAIGDLEIVVNYRPDSETHQFLDSAYDNKTEFQLIVNYIEDQDAGKVEAVIVSGNINSRMISGDKDDVVRMAYTYSPRTIISMGTRLIPPVLRRGDYGVGSDGTPDYPQYSPQEAEGNAFVMIPAADLDNPAGTDLYGIELVSQPMGQSNTNLMLTDSGDLRIYARNNTTPWSRVYTSGESDTLYLSKANNLSDLDNVITARSNLGILSTTENDARYMIGSRNLSELTDKDTALANLGIISLSAMDTRYLKTASNLSDLVDKASARSNLQVDSVRQSIGTTPGQYNAFTNPNASYELRIANNGEWRVANNETNGTSALSIGGGGTGALDVPNAKVNLQVDRLNQFGATTSLTSGDRTKSIIVNDGGTWGGYNETSQSYIPLGINQGGTGGWDVNSAKANLQVERLQQQDNGTFVRGNAPDTGIFMMEQNWGAMKLSTGAPIALGLTYGGTGATTVGGIKTNIGLAENDTPAFLGINAITRYDITSTNGGIYASTLYSTTGTPRSQSRLYNAINGTTGETQTVIHTKNLSNNIESYCTFNNSGLLSINALGVSGKSRTATLAVTDRMSVGTPADAQTLGARSIAIGDSDTGLAQRSDGVLDVYTDSVNLCTFTTSGFRTTRVISVETPDGNSRGMYVAPARTGTTNALVAGPVDGVANWGNWRDRASGVLVEIPGNAKCVNIWKSVQWGTAFTTSFDTYNPDPNTVEARLNIGGAYFMYTSAGVGTATSWVSTSDQRLKSNIEEITDSLDKLKKLTGYTYDKRSDLTPNEHTYTSHEAGLIAQEVQKVLPEAVTSSGDESLLAVNSYAVQALQINATKELDAKVEANEETIAVLTSKVEAQALQLEAQQQQIDELKALVQSLITK
ncbi:tail fiber domain-containing protein [Citrobacter freundii]|uniref:tail fiber domain-containing protein n=1 Tax=Citrobacter freundii TaxID=546 RepID=UPI003AAAD083